MKNAIVTGANGFVGAAVVNELVRHGYEVYAIGHKNHFDHLKTGEHIKCISCELSEILSLKTKLPVQSYDSFYHFAWAGSAGPQRGNVRVQLQNIQGTTDAIQVASEIGCRRFIGAGSIMEYEANAVLQQSEAVSIGNIYGSSKLAAHIMGLVKAKILGIDFVWGLITNIYGPGEISSRLINITIKKCLSGMTPQFTSGEQNYDFIYIDDAARAFRLIGERGQHCQSYVIGSSHAKKLKEFLMEMQAAIAPESAFQFGRMPFIGVSLPKSYFDCAKTEADTGFKAKVSFEEGCKKTAAWWAQQLVTRK